MVNITYIRCSDSYQFRKLDWEEFEVKEKPARYRKIVVLKHMFTPAEIEASKDGLDG
jgi:hypothetical protein